MGRPTVSIGILPAHLLMKWFSSSMVTYNFPNQDPISWKNGGIILDAVPFGIL